MNHFGRLNSMVITIAIEIDLNFLPDFYVTLKQFDGFAVARVVISNEGSFQQKGSGLFTIDPSEHSQSFSAISNQISQVCLNTFKSAKMCDLPDLPFEKVLSYLPLEDLLRVRAVSKRFYLKINRFRVRSLCFSKEKRDYIEVNHRLVVGEFTQNLISSSRFESFFLSVSRSSATSTGLSEQLSECSMPGVPFWPATESARPAALCSSLILRIFNH